MTYIAYKTRMERRDPMKTVLYDYDVYPKVFPVGKEVTVTIRPLGAHAAFREPDRMTLNIFGLDDGVPRYYELSANGQAVPFVCGEDGCIRFTHAFASEQRYLLRLLDRETGKKLHEFCVYAVDEDLCGRYPFVGDLHVHTCRSDGKQAPAIVCADYRKHGYDFMVISDHRRYYPSLEAIAAYKDAPIELCIVPGEEVHMPNRPGFINDVHIVSFGGRYSVNALVDDVQIAEVGDAAEKRSYEGFPCPEVRSYEAFREEILALAETLNIPEDVEKFCYACCYWVFEQIRKAEGLGIFAHPYWVNDVYHVPERVLRYIFQQQPFDAFEVLGGEAYYEQNGFQTLRYYDLRAKGKDFPIVGSTDSHSSVNNDNAYLASTMVFARENERAALIEAVKSKYSVAIDGRSAEYRLVGDFRLARYACFLLEEFFPLHDEMCFEEGRAMKDYACGEEDAKDVLAVLSGRMKRQREKYFAF